MEEILLKGCNFCRFFYLGQFQIIIKNELSYKY